MRTRAEDPSRTRPRYLYALLLPAGLVPACGFLPELSVSADGRETSESGTSVTVTVQPRGEPQGPLDVFGVSSNPGEGTVSPTLHFDASNWSSAQALRITGVDDDRQDGDTSYTVDVFAQQAGRRWLLKRLALVNRDDDSARFEAIADLPGGRSFVHAVSASADGNVIAGQSESALGPQAFRWSAGATRALGDVGSDALSVSADGSRIVGSVVDASYESGNAAAEFFLDQPPRQLAAPPQPGPDAGLLLWFVSATVALDDGTTYGTCHQYGAYGEPIGCRRREDGTLELVEGSYLYAATPSGHYAGTQDAERHAPFSSRAFLDGSTLAFPSSLACAPNIACSAEVRAMSADAATLVGTSSLPIEAAAPGGTLYERAFLYTAADGFTFLPDLDGGELASGAYALSTDLRIVAGFGFDETGQQATLWIDRQPRALSEILLDLDVEIPDGWSLREVRAVSSDGRVLVGNGINPQGDDQAFRVTLAHAL